MSKEATKDLAVRVVKRLREAGHEALLAGGSVRDELMGRRPADYDIATSATPDQVKRLFRRVLMIGAKFGVAMIIERGRRIEVTTFRTDLSYSDGRRPDGVVFTTAEEDAKRRDFTINGMFADPLTGEVIDHVGGRADLATGVIRAIGEPLHRFREDYLRMLRAVRFAARFGFEIDPATAEAIRQVAPRIADMSGERIRDELEKMFSRPSADRAVRLMAELDLLRALLPELVDPPERADAAMARVDVLARRQDVTLTMAGLLCDLTAADIRGIVRRWGASNRLRDTAVWIAEHRDDWRTLSEAPPAALKRLAARRDYPILETIWRVREKLATGSVRCCRQIHRRIRQLDPRHIAPAPLLTGSDLHALGVPDSPRLGKILDAVYEAQLNEEIATLIAAKKLARKLIDEGTPREDGNDK